MKIVKILEYQLYINRNITNTNNDEKKRNIQKTRTTVYRLGSFWSHNNDNLGRPLSCTDMGSSSWIEVITLKTTQ